MTLAVQRVSKAFGPVKAVQDVSFTVPAGRVCGLLGSNGAGKTTTMRMIMRIFLPDQGEIRWQGRPVTDAVRAGFGYLPEERGLYPKMQVREQLIYLTQLKGLTRSEAARRADLWIDRLDLGEYALRKVEQLSKGNQQKVQFAAAAASGPELCILDEPFTGLDPVNTMVMEQAFRTLAGEGTTILFSSHNMDQVEALCDDVVLMHRSRVVLSGSLRDVKRAARRQTVRLRLESGDYGFLREFPGLRTQSAAAGAIEISIPDGLDPNRLLARAMAAGTVTEWSLGEPSLREIYIEKVGGADA
ncbi:ABC-2 type transport system ATP-binding protein [Symbiobacterium terraclitae]|uniref:ABC-2 type transport system ATP-binding protein n=1 Tax=Symbiobacterium terraclitae TaxID=557451 RepID=A0ABS4JVQ2_9FIRM|nr:ABC-2 type transport system ATP-binding protein [Symbiobacterium terraclitae]